MDYIENGFGKVVYPSGEIYEGEWKNGLRHGQGKYTFSNGEVYDGEWKNGQRDGFGLWSCGFGVPLKVEYRGGQLWNGYGTTHYTDGSTYIGDIKDGKQHGRGVMLFSNGDTYEGEWQDGFAHGHGQAKYVNGTVYNGEWKNGNPNQNNSGCYIATAVYGSYDCPQVWTLRRFRDYALANTFFGKLFIRIYYAISPSLVKLFGTKQWFKKLWKYYLDKWIITLNKRGYDNTRYIDRKW